MVGGARWRVGVGVAWRVHLRGDMVAAAAVAAVPADLEKVARVAAVSIGGEVMSDGGGDGRGCSDSAAVMAAEAVLWVAEAMALMMAMAAAEMAGAAVAAAAVAATAVLSAMAAAATCGGGDGDGGDGRRHAPRPATA